MSIARRTGRPCEACRHPARDEIDRALLDPRAVTADLSRRFSISQDGLARHRSLHLPRAMRREAIAAFSEAEGLRGAALVEQVGVLRDRALMLLDAAEVSGDLSSAIRATREIRECLVAEAKLRGEITDPAVTVNVAIMADPSWQHLQSILLAALAPHEAARRDVLRALEAIAA